MYLWVDLSKPDDIACHDREWGVPRYGDQRVCADFKSRKRKE